ncbi:hypothetical protein HAX54_040429, partial [Datura stramonium]|nr:hypothetical protein [Datura stramonium]
GDAIGLHGFGRCKNRGGQRGRHNERCCDSLGVRLGLGLSRGQVKVRVGPKAGWRWCTLGQVSLGVRSGLGLSRG